MSVAVGEAPSLRVEEARPATEQPTAETVRGVDVANPRGVREQESLEATDAGRQRPTRPGVVFDRLASRSGEEVRRHVDAVGGGGVAKPLEVGHRRGEDEPVAEPRDVRQRRPTRHENVAGTGEPGGGDGHVGRRRHRPGDPFEAMPEDPGRRQQGEFVPRRHPLAEGATVDGVAEQDARHRLRLVGRQRRGVGPKRGGDGVAGDGVRTREPHAHGDAAGVRPAGRVPVGGVGGGFQPEQSSDGHAIPTPGPDLYVRLAGPTATVKWFRTDPPATVTAVSFDLFGTLVAASTPDDPGAAVARELRNRGVAVPTDWTDAYRTPHVDAPDGAEVPLPAHVAGALRSRGVEASDTVVRHAVVAAFDPKVRRREGVDAALTAARERGPVGLCSNCSVPELVPRALVRADLRGGFDAVVTSAACGFRKPHPRPFETVAADLGVDPSALVHVGDDPRTDGGVENLGGRFVDAADTLATLGDRLEGEP